MPSSRMRPSVSREMRAGEVRLLVPQLRRASPRVEQDVDERRVDLAARFALAAGQLLLGDALDDQAVVVAVPVDGAGVGRDAVLLEPGRRPA